MAITKFKTPDQYIEFFPNEIQTVLKKVRNAIRKAVPEAEEVISYNIPAFKYHGWLLYYSAYTNHFSLSCPPPSAIFTKFKKELEPYEVSKSTIRFPISQPVPSALITAMAKLRADENKENEAKKLKKKK